MSIEVMREIGIDISGQTSDPIEKYLTMNIEHVITLCDNAAETCPTFPGAQSIEHWGLKDPFGGWEFDKNQLPEYRKIRDIIQEKIKEFISKN